MDLGTAIVSLYGIKEGTLFSVRYELNLYLAGVMDELERSSNSSMTPAGSDIGEFYQML
jgi:hypothetical protein